MSAHKWSGAGKEEDHLFLVWSSGIGMSQQAEPTGQRRSITVNGSDRSVDLREHDVVCEKGRGDHERWPGNKLYRYLINVNKESYNDLAPMERSAIIGKIISTIKEKNGWFVQHDESTGKWAELNEEKVRKKVSDDLRREVRRRREKRSNSTVFSAKLRALKEKEEQSENSRDILQPVDDPRQTDVLFGPGARRHPGNKTYWKLMKLNLDHYIISPYGARSMISRSIVQGIRDQNGRFLEQDSKTAVWYEISDKRAIEKTSHALSNKKYKTRKRQPDEPGADTTGKGSSEEDEDSECSFQKSDSATADEQALDQSKAKKRTKKFRLLQRMGEPELPEDETRDDGKEDRPPVALRKVTESPRMAGTSPGKNGAPASPPYMMEKAPRVHPRVVVSPNDSRSSLSDESRDDYVEYEDTHAFRRVHSRHAPPVPDASEYMYPAEIEPRLTRYEAYVDGERYHQDRRSYKASAAATATVAAGAGGPPQQQPPPPPPPPHPSYASRLDHHEYAHPPPPPIRHSSYHAAERVPSIRSAAAAAAAAAHHAAHLEAEYLAHREQPMSPSYGSPMAPPSRLVKSSRSAGYWVNNDWGVPPPTPRRMDGYDAWR